MSVRKYKYREGAQHAYDAVLPALERIAKALTKSAPGEEADD